MKILMLSGVNLNMLGRRNAEFYGDFTLKTLEKQVKNYAQQRGAKVVCKCTNSESKIVDILQKTDADAVILNAGAYSHYSYAIRDCIECISQKVAEVHLSDVDSRESFRKVDVLSDVVAARFTGKKMQSYFDAVDFLTGKQ